MNAKKIAFLGVGIALYVVLGCILNIPLFAGSHIQTDLGYIAFGCCLYLLGWHATIVGVIGCLLESLVTSGWIPYGWILGQLFIGIVCGLIYKKTQSRAVHIIVTILAVFVGVAGIKTAVECAMFSIPFVVKFPKNVVAFIADAVPMLLGLFLGYRLNKEEVIKQVVED